MARAAARACPAWSSSSTGAPKTARTASPMNLLTRPCRSSTSSTTTPKKRLSRSTTSAGSRSEASVVEPTMSTNSTETTRVSPPSSTSLPAAAAATSLPTWRPKRSRRCSRSRSPRTIWLKPAWSWPSSVPSYTWTSVSRSPSSTRSIALRTERIGETTARALSQVTRKPKQSTTAPSARIDDRQPDQRRLADRHAPGCPRRCRPTTGAPVPRPQKISIRRRTPNTLARTCVSPRQRAGGDRAQRELAEQVGDRADHDAGDADGEGGGQRARRAAGTRRAG